MGDETVFVKDDVAAVVASCDAISIRVVIALMFLGIVLPIIGRYDLVAFVAVAPLASRVRAVSTVRLRPQHHIFC